MTISLKPFEKSIKHPNKVHFKFFKIYRYADRFDLILMVAGVISAIGTGVGSRLIFFVYKEVLNALVDLGKSQSDPSSISNSSRICSPHCDPSELNHKILKSLKYFFLLGLFNFLFYWFAWSCWSVSCERQIRRIKSALFTNILRQEISWFDQNSAGELNNRLNTDIDKLKNAINEKVPDCIYCLSKSFSCLFYALIIGWKLTLVYLSVAPVIIFIFNLTIKLIVRYTNQEFQAFGAASNIAHEVLSNIRTVTAFGAQKHENERFTKSLIESKRIAIRKGFVTGICVASHQFFSFAALSLTFWYGPHLVRSEPSVYNVGSMLTVFVACAMATMSFAQVIPSLEKFSEALASGRKIFEIIDKESKINVASENGLQPTTLVGNIEFRGITFNYPTRKEAKVLDNVSLEIPSGKTVALVGPSGCGKSTLIQLLQRFYDPDEGQILFDDNNIQELNVSWLRSQMSIVSQEPVLFPGTIEENIRFGKMDATDDEIQQAAKLANAHDFIMALPDKYKTILADKLSGGEKQRVAIARALISNPKILLLDEATSALDNHNEQAVQKAFENAKSGRTTIVIAHRLHSIRNADLIIGFEHGHVIECGTHQELMDKKGLYYDMVITQTEIDKAEQAEDENADKISIEERIKIIRAQSIVRSFSREVSHVSERFDFNIDGEIEGIEPFDSQQTKSRVPFTLRILRYNSPEWYWMLLGSIACLVNGTIQPTIGLVTSKVFAAFTNVDLQQQAYYTNFCAVILLSIGIISGLTDFLSSFSFVKSGEALTMRMRSLTFAALLRQEISFFDYEINSVPSLVSRLSSDSAALRGISGNRIGVILQLTSTIATASAICFASGWKLTTVALCFIPVLLINGSSSGDKNRQADENDEKLELNERAAQKATLAIGSIRTVAALGREQYFIDLYKKALDHDFNEKIYSGQRAAIFASLSNSMICFFQGTTFAYGSHLVLKREMNFDHVYRIFTVVFYAIMSIGRSLATAPDYSQGKAAAINILTLHERKSTIDPEEKTGLTLDEVEGRIEFCDIRFRYPSQPTRLILPSFSLRCHLNGTTALVGPSGSGKSTSIALLQRFYDPWYGKILLDGHDITVFNVQWLRSLFGLVQQQPILFNMTIGENIAYGNLNQQASQESIEAAAKMANVHDIIVTLPQAYQTMCGSNGSQLSGGQKQRIAIARALIRSPKILLLDEATSALDIKSEQIVQEAIDQAKAGRTCLTVAHRLSTIRNAEKIVVVHRGKVREQGTHENLMNRNGLYARLESIQK